jgi:F-type H+-transporting ATPase subunit b
MFLFPHIGTIIWMTLIFLIVFFILTKYAWRPLLKALDERETSVAFALKSAEEAKKKLEKLEKDQQQIINQARAQKETLIREGIEQRDKIIAEAKDKTLIQTQKMVEDAHVQIRLEREAVFAEMKNQIAGLSVEIATKVVRAELEDKVRQQKLVKTLVDEVSLN